ncbi:hypothetical protein PVAND_001682 [Polypedilum vanderplanki]|uniref:Glucose dehydrogenase n=1 Tax=Polypedilum vanderplanki TaxID=319348 RepID=A0A9J6BP45_POLVA|nr:hypothetical protein PVAND_001682 [Polypedilum vanderplanki]
MSLIHSNFIELGQNLVYLIYEQTDTGFIKVKLPWTEKCTETICNQVKNRKAIAFDYVIIGSGHSGAILAYRLALAQPDKTVLLIEAGGDPLAQSVSPRLASFSSNSAASFDYNAVHNPNASLAYENGARLTRGKSLGGSSTLPNSGSICGSPRNFDEWAE